jgi:transposase
MSKGRKGPKHESPAPHAAAARKEREPRTTYTPQFKAEAVRLLRERKAAGASVTQVARELDLKPGVLWEWAQKVEGGRPVRDGALPGETLEEENRRLRRENAILRQEREFAKKAAAFFLKESL